MTPQTNVATEALRTLHRIRRQLEDLRERLVRGPRMIAGHEANIQRVCKELENARAEHLAIKTATDDKQHQLSSSETEVQRRQSQLLQSSSNTEYQALKDQIAATQAANEVLEVEILEGMEKLDTAAERTSHAEAEVAAAEQELVKVRDEVESQQPRIEADIVRLQKELSECEASLPADFREHYFRLVRGRGEDALAAVNGEYCSGCNHHVPVNMINDLMLSRPVACLSCGRLLYLPEDA